MIVYRICPDLSSANFQLFCCCPPLPLPAKRPPAKVMTKMLEGSKNLTYAATTVTVRGALNAASEAQLAALADELSR